LQEEPMPTSSLIDRCRARGLRITGQRRIIADIVAAAHDHPDAEEVHRRAALRDPQMALSTVYRTLKLFADIGAIETHRFDGRRQRIESEPRAHHDHLIDVESGKVIEFSSPEIERLQVEIAKSLGYRLTGHRLELYGERLATRRTRSRSGQ
jgi:Fur family ferric uptake transcriptional regulator